MTPTFFHNHHGCLCQILFERESSASQSALRSDRGGVHAAGGTTYLSCGAERLPGTRTGKQRGGEPTATSCWLSSHTHTTQSTHTASRVRMKTLRLLSLGISRALQGHSLIYHHDSSPSLSPSLHPPAPLSLSCSCVCVCVLLSGQAGWALIWKSSGSGVEPSSWLNFPHSPCLTA